MQNMQENLNISLAEILFDLLTSGLVPALPATGNTPSSPPNLQAIALSV